MKESANIAYTVLKNTEHVCHQHNNVSQVTPKSNPEANIERNHALIINLNMISSIKIHNIQLDQSLKEIKVPILLILSFRILKAYMPQTQ